MAVISSGSTQNGQSGNGIQIAHIPLGQYKADNNPFNEVKVENTDEPITKNNLSELVKAMTDGWSKFTERISDESKNLDTSSNEETSDTNTEDTSNSNTEKQEQEQNTINDKLETTDDNNIEEISNIISSKIDAIEQDVLSSFSSISTSYDANSSAIEEIISTSINTGFSDTLLSASDNDDVVSVQDTTDFSTISSDDSSIIQPSFNSLSTDISMEPDIVSTESISLDNTPSLLPNTKESAELSIDDIQNLITTDPSRIQTTDTELNNQIADLAKLGPAMSNDIRLLIEDALKNGTKVYDSNVNNDIVDTDNKTYTISDNSLESTENDNSDSNYFDTNSIESQEGPFIIDTSKIVESITDKIELPEYKNNTSLLENVIDSGEIQKLDISSDTLTHDDTLQNIEIDTGIIPSITDNVIRNQNIKESINDNSNFNNSKKQEYSNNNTEILTVLGRIEASLNSGFSEMRLGLSQCLDKNLEPLESYNLAEDSVVPSKENITTNNFTQERIG